MYDSVNNLLRHTSGRRGLIFVSEAEAVELEEGL